METFLPDYVEALKQAEAYPEKPKKISLSETRWSYLFLADALCYKIKKTGNEFASSAVKEAYCHEECQLLKRYNPDWPVEVVQLKKTAAGYQLGGKGGQIEEYALKMEALSKRRFLSSLLDNKTVDMVDISLIAQNLAEIHAQSGVPAKSAETGKAEGFHSLCDDMLYQMKRYFDTSITQPIIGMIRHPLEKFMDSNASLFSKRIRKGRVVQGHGALDPEHIHVQGETVRLISPQEVYKKYSVLDAANDVATLMLQLMVNDREELSEHFHMKYLEVSRDRELDAILPAYLTYSALMHGVRTCEEKVASSDESLGTVALEFFNLAARYSRELHKD